MKSNFDPDQNPALNNPALDPANNDSFAGALRFFFSKMLQGVNGMLPAQVMAFDRTTNRVQVKLLISMLTSNGGQVPRSQIASLPVLILGGGGFMLNFNLKAGDLGWVLASDRDISLFLQSYTQTPPNSSRMFSFSDGMFIPDVMRGYTIATEDEANAVLQSLDGTVRVAIWPNKVKITAPTTEITSPIVTITGNTSIVGNLAVSGMITAGGGISVTGGSGFSVTGNITLTGNFTQTGTLAVTGDITATGNITPHV